MRRATDPLIRARPRAFLLLAYCSLFPATADACSLAPDYKAPTNFELVQQADVILVGTVIKSIENESPDYHNLLVKPSLLLKGEKLPNAVFIHGMLAGEILESGGKRLVIQSKDSQPFDLWRPHPEGGSGSCSRYTFKKGYQLLLFFKRKGDELVWLDPPYGRGSEDVSGPDALWVKAVKIYAKASLLPQEQQKAELVRQMKTSRDGDASGKQFENELLADDIERQLDGVTGWSASIEDKNTSKLARWQNNIYNAIFFDVPEPIEAKRETVKSKPDWKTIALLLGFLNLITLLIIFGLRMRRKVPAT